MRESRYESTTLAIFGKEVQDELELYLRRMGLNAVVLIAPSQFRFAKCEYSPQKGAKLPKRTVKLQKGSVK